MATPPSFSLAPTFAQVPRGYRYPPIPPSSVKTSLALCSEVTAPSERPVVGSANTTDVVAPGSRLFPPPLPPFQPFSFSPSVFNEVPPCDSSLPRPLNPLASASAPSSQSPPAKLAILVSSGTDLLAPRSQAVGAVARKKRKRSTENEEGKVGNDDMDDDDGARSGSSRRLEGNKGGPKAPHPNGVMLAPRRLSSWSVQINAGGKAAGFIAALSAAGGDYSEWKTSCSWLDTLVAELSTEDSDKALSENSLESLVLKCRRSSACETTTSFIETINFIRLLGKVNWCLSTHYFLDSSYKLTNAVTNSLMRRNNIAASQVFKTHVRGSGVGESAFRGWVSKGAKYATVAAGGKCHPPSFRILKTLSSNRNAVLALVSLYPG
jgi:hypothetical protein